MAKTKKTVTYAKAWYAVAVARIAVGFVFLWAFFDKLMGLGFATASEKAWINGGSPTAGFLKMGVNPESPLASFFNGLAGSSLVDWLFMIGLLGIGSALLLGIGLRIAAVTGSLLLVLMWAALLPLENNPIIDDHIVYAVMLWVFALGNRKWSLFEQWSSEPYVKKNPWLW